MKKIILIMAAIMLCLVVSKAQDKSLTLNSVYYGIGTNSVADTVTSVYTTWSLEIQPVFPQSHYYFFDIKSTKVSGTGNAWYSLYGKNFSNQSYTFITNKRIWQSTTDTIFELNQTSTRQNYRYYLIKLHRRAGTLKVRPNTIEATFKY